MENFVAYNPTTLHFGKNILTSLGTTLKEYGNRVLIVYGTGSVKKSGLYDRIMTDLKSQGFVVSEFGGISEEHFKEHYRKESHGTKWEALELEIKRIPYGPELEITKLDFE